MNSPIKTHVKICGITTVEDALHISHSGADAIGLVFYEKSPRNISINKATEICASLPPFVSSVGLFLNAPQEFVETVLKTVPLDLLQFHGTETPDYCDSFNRPYIKAIGMKKIQSEKEFTEYANKYPNARGLLVDSHAKGEAGGTGETFDWNHIPQHDKPIILAGGLNPNNVAEALQQTSVYAIDLSSGVESQPGIKDKQKVTQLMEEVKRVQCR